MALNYHKKPQESKVMKYVNLAGTAIMVNLLFLLACSPVLLLFLATRLPSPWNLVLGAVAYLTVGPAFSGLFSAVRFMIRGDGAIRGFWEGVCSHPVRMVITGAVFMGILTHLFTQIDMAYQIWVQYDAIGDLILYGVITLVPLAVFTALIPLNIYIGYDAMDWLKNGINLLIKAPHWVLLSALLLWAPVVCLLWIPDIFYMVIVVFVGFWFTLATFVATLMLKNPLIDRLLEHQEEHPELYEEEEEEETEDEE